MTLLSDTQSYSVGVLEQIRNLKRQRGKIMREYVPCVKNRIMGYELLFGKGHVRHVAHTAGEDSDDTEMRDLFFRDIRYRSNLRKIRDKITSLGEEYRETIQEIRDLANAR